MTILKCNCGHCNGLRRAQFNFFLQLSICLWFFSIIFCLQQFESATMAIDESIVCIQSHPRKGDARANRISGSLFSIFSIHEIFPVICFLNDYVFSFKKTLFLKQYFLNPSFQRIPFCVQQRVFLEFLLLQNIIYFFSNQTCQEWI